MLEDLPPEAWVLGDRADTVSTPETGIMLGHEGLARLARHVVRSYVARSPAEVDTTFDWRASLPGLVRARPAPQYWVWNPGGFHHKTVGSYFSGFVAHLAETYAKRNEGVLDMAAVLERIEQLLPGTAEGPSKTLMVAIYALWHRALAPSDHRPVAADLLAQHEHLLQRLDLPSFVVGLLSDDVPEWTDDQWHTLATARREERSRRRHLDLPAGFDAALQVMAADRLMHAGHTDDALTLARFAVEELPGNEPLIAWEASLAVGDPVELDPRVLALGMGPGDSPKQNDGSEAAAVPAEPESAESDADDDSDACLAASSDHDESVSDAAVDDGATVSEFEPGDT